MASIAPTSGTSSNRCACGTTTAISPTNTHIFAAFITLFLFFTSHKSIKSTGMPLLRLILYFGRQFCTLPHDKVYGLLGLTNNTQAVHVDYGVAPRILFFKILESSNFDTILEECYGLADALHITIEITATKLKVSFPRHPGPSNSMDNAVSFLGFYNVLGSEARVQFRNTAAIIVQ